MSCKHDRKQFFFLHFQAAVAAAATEAPALEASAVRSAATAATTTLAADSLRLAPSEADTEVNNYKLHL
jgi:hypothetical protein